MQLNDTTLPLALLLRWFGMRIRLRGWNRVLRAIFNPDRQAEYRFQIPFGRFTYPGRANDYVDWNAFFYGLYEFEDLGLLAAVAGGLRRPVFVDVGANVGHHSLFMSAHAETVHAFEPNPDAWPLIEERIALNQISNIELHRCGLGNRDGTVPLYRSDRANLGAASLVSGANGNPLTGHIPVPVRNGDRYFRGHGIETVDILKIDVEGFEPAVVDGLSMTIERNRPIIMVEVGEVSGSEFGDIEDFKGRFPAGYRFYVLHGVGHILRRVGLVELTGELYRSGGNFYCVPSESVAVFETCAKAAI